MNETPAYKSGNLISTKNPVQMLTHQFVNKTRNFSHHKNIDLSLIRVFSYKYQFMDEYRTAS